MKIDEIKREDGFHYIVYEHQSNVFERPKNKGNLDEKLKFVDEFLETIHASFKHYTKKDVLLAYSKSDNEVAEYYRQLYPRGGSRKNAGRKQGSVQKAPKSDRTERFTLAITQQEKEILIKQLELYRQKNK